MINLARSFKNNVFSLLVALLLGLGLVTGFTACGGGGSDDGPLPDQDASGLFKDGTAELDGGAVMLDDLRGFVHNGRLIIFSISGHLLIDGIIVSISSDDYTATVDIYETGTKTQSDVSVMGTVMTESRITGALNGSGIASGSFTLTFDPLYGRGASFERVDTSTGFLAGDIYMSVADMATNNFDFFSATNYDVSIQKSDPVLLCIHDGTYSITDSTRNIYDISENITTGIDCPEELDNDTYTGFVSVVDGNSVDDTVLYAATNGEYSHFAVLVK